MTIHPLLRTFLPAASAALAVAIGGCGLTVASADLFVVQRFGQGKTLTLLVNDAGTIRCDSGKARPLSDQLLLRARDLATSLDNDAKSKLRFQPSPRSVYRYSVKLQDGTVSFDDTAAARHPELAQTELFVLQAAQSPCALK